MAIGKKLIVNADDYGMSLSISRGIIKAAAEGIVRSTTVMTCAHDFDTAMDELFESGINIDIGFHANLTWGQPVLEPEEIPTLVNDDGMFLSRLCLLKKSVLGRISEEEAYKELKAQFIKLHKRTNTITHIDGHHHIHAFPVIRNAVERIAREFKISYIRSPYEGSWSTWHWCVLRKSVVACLKAAKPAYWKKRGFMTSDNFAGFALSAGKDMQKRWLLTLMRVPSGLTEIMVHPGHFSPRNDKYNVEREEEIRVLTNPSLIDSAKECGVEITNFRSAVSLDR